MHKEEIKMYEDTFIKKYNEIMKNLQVYKSIETQT